MHKASEWWRSVKALDDWAHGYDWKKHLDGLNRKYILTGERELVLSVEGWPPAWFTGNIEALRPRQWMLVVSLNPARPSPDHYAGRTGDDSWAFWCDHNRDSSFWNKKTKFFPQLAELARRALPPHLSTLDDETITSDYMLFLEFCPYASTEYPIPNWDKANGAKSLADSDIGFAINRQIRHLAFHHGQPLVALVQGGHARSDVEDFQCPGLSKPASSIDLGGLKVSTGRYVGWHGQVPILGFPFINARNTLTRDERIALLGAEIARLTGRG